MYINSELIVEIIDWKAGSIPRCLQRFNEVRYASYLTLLLLGYGHRQYNKFPLQRRYPRACSWVLHLKNGETFPIKYTHRGEEISPEFIIKNLSPDGKTIAIIFDDLDQPMNHWIIWDIPAMNVIPENISKDILSQNIGNTKQRSKYRGPNPPKGIKHKYQFNIYVLDCELKIKNISTKQLQKAMEGHIMQYGFINGYFW